MNDNLKIIAYSNYVNGQEFRYVAKVKSMAEFLRLVYAHKDFEGMRVGNWIKDRASETGNNYDLLMTAKEAHKLFKYNRAKRKLI